MTSRRRPDPFAPHQNYGDSTERKFTARLKAGTANRKAIQEGLGDDSWEDIQQEVDALPCDWCAQKELPCPEGHLLHKANTRLREAGTAAMLAFGQLTPGGKRLLAGFRRDD